MSTGQVTEDFIFDPANIDLLVPADGGSIVSTPNFSWNLQGDFDTQGSVSFYICDDQASDTCEDSEAIFTTVVDQASRENLDYAATAGPSLVAGMEYTWRLEVEFEGVVTFSTSSSFLIGHSITLQLPADDSVVNAEYPLFTWQRSPSFEELEFYLCSGVACAVSSPSLIHSASLPLYPDSYFYAPTELPLQDGQDYAWLVRGRIGSDWSESAVFGFNVTVDETTPPGTPHIDYPGNADTDVGISIPLTWIPTGGIPAETFEYQIITGGFFASSVPIHVTEINSGASFADQYNKQYFWRVRACRDEGSLCSAWSGNNTFDAWRFTTGAQPADPPVVDGLILHSPADGETTGTSPVMTWSVDTASLVPVTDVIKIEIYEDQALSLPHYVDAQFSEVWNGQLVAPAMQSNQTYYWRMARCEILTCSDWTSVRSFTTDGVDATRYYYLTDHLGSTRVVLNDEGVVTDFSDYYPFGLEMPGRSTQSGTKALENYTGHELDSDTGLHYANARFYDSVIGRWGVRDPLDEFATPYSYVGSNPIIFVDPSGLKGEAIATQYYDEDGELIYDDGEDNSLVVYTNSSIVEGCSGDSGVNWGCVRNDRGSDTKILHEPTYWRWVTEVEEMLRAESDIGLGITSDRKGNITVRTASTFGENLFLTLGPFAIVKALGSLGAIWNRSAWYKSTFRTRIGSINYHTFKHGKGRSVGQYTKAAQDFFNKHKHLGTKMTLKDGSSGLKIRTKVQINGKGKSVMGIYKPDGRIVTFTG